MDYTQKSPSIVSFCTGIRGIERGLERVFGKINVLVNVEIEAFIVENLVQQMEQGLLDAAPIYSDVKTFPAEIFRGKVDGIIGGYPCQPFSHAGQRKGTDDPRHLWPHIERHIRAIRPIWCFFENVSGHLTLGFPEVRESLRNLGYAVEAGIFTAEEVGAPHQRERLFILAIRNGCKLAYSNNKSNRSYKGRFQPKTPRNGKLYYTNCSPAEYKIPTGRQSVTITSDAELGNAKYHGQFTEPELRGNEAASNSRRQEEQREAEQFKGADRPANGSSLSRCENGSEFKKLEYANNPRCKKQCKPFTNGQKWQLEFRRCEIWPSSPGHAQHGWEEARTATKSEMGITINGYNFREDILRAAGNSVVEQCAELAFITLFGKHKNI